MAARERMDRGESRGKPNATRGVSLAMLSW